MTDRLEFVWFDRELFAGLSAGEVRNALYMNVARGQPVRITGSDILEVFGSRSEMHKWVSASEFARVGFADGSSIFMARSPFDYSPFAGLASKNDKSAPPL